MKALIIGAKGGLGRNFLEHGPRLKSQEQWEWVGVDRSHVDVTDEAALKWIFDEEKPGIVFNCTGYTAVDKAEDDRDTAQRVNAWAVGRMAAECTRLRIPFVTYSTDYVFKGDVFSPRKETDPTAPLSVYGATKKEGEDLALKFPGALVIRTSWLYSEFGKSFPRTILEKAIKGDPLKIVSDQSATPTWSKDLVEATFELLDRRATGLYHYACAGEASWFDFATKAIELFNFKTGQRLAFPAAIRTGEFPAKAKRPVYSVLDCAKAKNLEVTRRPWEAALSQFIDQLIAQKTLSC